MYVQHLIKRSLGTVEAQARVGALRRARPGLHRTGLAAAVCEEFGFREARGVAQTSGCLSALRALERVGSVRLPAALSGGFRARLAGCGGLCVGGAAACGAGSLDRLGRGASPGAPASRGGAVAVPDPAGRGLPEPVLARAWAAAAAPAGGLRGALRLRAVPGGDVRRRHALGNQPAGGQLAAAGRDRGSGPAGPGQRGGGGTQAGVCLRAGGRLAAAAGRGRGAVPGGAAGALGGAGGRRLGGERVWRGAAGRCPAERPAGGVAALRGAAPTASLPAAAKGDRALVKGHCRFADRPNDGAATPENILRPHRERTLRRMRGCKEPTSAAWRSPFRKPGFRRPRW